MFRGLLWFAALLGGAIFFILLASFRNKIDDRGYFAFLFPLMPGFAYVIIELSFLLTAAGTGREPSLFLGGAEASVFSSMALSCVFFYEAHYRLNRVSRKGIVNPRVFVGLTAGNYLLLAAGALVPGAADMAERLLEVSVYAALLYAGVTTVCIVRYGNRLLDSTWAGIVAAGLGLFYYPFFALTDVFALPIPFLEEFRPVRLQAYAVYYLAVCAALIGSLLRSLRRRKPLPVLAKAELTRREEELARLLLKGAGNREVADELAVSLSTVKTHARNLYRKLGIHSRDELASIMSEKDT